MQLRLLFPLVAIVFLFLGSATVWAQTGAIFKIHYASNLITSDPVVNMTNTGASEAAHGNICVNVYVFTPDEQLQACCSAFLSPNALASYSISHDLAFITLTPIVPSDVVIKLIATAALGTTCPNSTAGAVGDKNNLPVPGLLAWATALHALPTIPVTYGATETRFEDGILSQQELARTTSLCANILANGSGLGICNVAKIGGR
jgi:hypothetical protein